MDLTDKYRPHRLGQEHLSTKFVTLFKGRKGRTRPQDRILQAPYVSRPWCFYEPLVRR